MNQTECDATLPKCPGSLSSALAKVVFDIEDPDRPAMLLGVAKKSSVVPGRMIPVARPDGLRPTMFLPETLTMYASQFSRPLIEHVLVGALTMHDFPPGETDASYDEIALPPSLAGGSHEISIVPSTVDGVAMTFRGTEGTV